MHKYLSCFILAVLFFSCSKNNDTMVINEEILEDTSPKLGIKYFGPQVNSFDEGVGIFEVADGYVSIEQLNIDYSNGLSEGYTNIAFRSLDSELKTTKEKIHETTTHDYIKSILQVDENFILLVEQNNEDKSIKERFIHVFDGEGELVKSKALTDFEGANITNIIDGELFYKNDIIYVSLNFGTTSYATALLTVDKELNIVGEQIFGNDVMGGIIEIDTDQKIFFIENSNSSNVLVMKVVNAQNGSLIDSFEYPFPEHLYFNVYKIVSKGDFIYLAGEVVFQNTNGLNGAILKINKLTGEQVAIDYWDTYGAIFDIVSKGDILFLNLWDKKLVETSIVKTDDSATELWNYTIFGNVRKLLLTKNGAIVFTGRSNNPSSPDGTTDVFIGILDQEGQLK